MDWYRLNRNLSTLQLLSSATKKQREALIATATRDQLMCLCDCATGIEDNAIKLTDEEIRELCKFMWLIHFFGKN